MGIGYEGESSSIGGLHMWLQVLGQGHTEARSLELSLGHPCWWLGPGVAQGTAMMSKVYTPCGEEGSQLF